MSDVVTKKQSSNSGPVLEAYVALLFAQAFQKVFDDFLL